MVINLSVQTRDVNVYLCVCVCVRVFVCVCVYVFVCVQLFARLEARRCLKDIEPALFPADGGPEHGD